MHPTAYAATFLTSRLSAIVPEWLGKVCEPRWTWLTMVVVVLVTLGTAAHLLLLPLPMRAPADLV